MRATYNTMRPIFKQIVRQARVGSIQGIVGAVSDARDWVADELAWLAANQPRDCYRDVYATWSSAIGKLSDGLALLDSGLREKNEADARRGLSLMEDSAASLDAYDQPTTLCGR
jgi:hypothetical protein